MTLSFSATFGVQPGYGDHASDMGDWLNISEAIHEEIDRVRATGGVVVGCVVQRANVFYPREFGCPELGESVVVITGAHNPKFATVGAWRAAVMRLLEALKTRFKQERVTATFSPCETVYLESADIPAVRSDGDENGR